MNTAVKETLQTWRDHPPGRRLVVAIAAVAGGTVVAGWNGLRTVSTNAYGWAIALALLDGLFFPFLMRAAAGKENITPAVGAIAIWVLLSLPAIGALILKSKSAASGSFSRLGLLVFGAGAAFVFGAALSDGVDTLAGAMARFVVRHL